MGEDDLNDLKVLMVTRLFPSKEFPTQGIFCAERAKALSRYADVRVMVPTPYWTRYLHHHKWGRYARVERNGLTNEGLPVSYPRYFLLPKVATWHQGFSMRWSVRREYIRRYSGWIPDVIDGHFAFPDGYAAVRLAKFLGRPSMVTCHGWDLREYPLLPFARSLLRRTLFEADRVLAVSPALRERAVQLGCPSENAIFLPNGVDPKLFRVRSKDECRRRLELPLEGHIAVCVGQLIDRKDQSILIQALAELSQSGQRPPHLVLVGDGPNRQRLTEEASGLGLMDYVHLVGERHYEEIPFWMGAADWFVLSSHYEGWPTVYFEAMACGRPVITSDMGSARSTVCHDDYGIVVDPNTPSVFAEAIKKACTRTFNTARIRAYAESHSWDRWAKSLVRIIHEVIDRRELT